MTSIRGTLNLMYSCFDLIHASPTSLSSGASQWVFTSGLRLIAVCHGVQTFGMSTLVYHLPSSFQHAVTRLLPHPYGAAVGRGPHQRVWGAEGEREGKGRSGGGG